MRKWVVVLMLAASASTPAMAQDEGRQHEEPGQDSAQEQRTEARAAQQAEPAQRVEAEDVERPARIGREVRQMDRQIMVATPTQNDNHSGGGHKAYHQDVRIDHGALHATDPTRKEHREYHREVTRDHRTEHKGWGRDSRRAGHGEYHRDDILEHGELHAADPTKREHRNWHQDVRRKHDRRHSAWDAGWRNNRSYDWRSHRGRYGSRYDFSNYHDPYRNGYRRFSIGFSMSPAYYSSRYWLNDPWQFRLPPAYGPYRWVRYYNDALLVNVYTGQVVDVEHNFFW